MHIYSNMVKLQYDQNKQFKITLPKQIVLAKGWKKGDKLEFEIDNNGSYQLLREQTPKGKCEKCSAPMRITSGPYGRFMACSAYPECKNTRSL